MPLDSPESASLQRSSTCKQDHLTNRIDVVAQKHNGGRGQAFVVFEEQTAATAAMRGLTGEMFYDRDLVRATPFHCLNWSQRPRWPSSRQLPVPNQQGLTGPQRITYARNASHATLSQADPESSREAAAVRAAKMTVSNAQGEYEQLERERVEEDMRLAGQASGKRDLDTDADADAHEGAEGPAGKKAKTEHVEEDEDMEMEMDEDDEGACLPPSMSRGPPKAPSYRAA